MEFSVYSFIISMIMASIMILLYTFLNRKMKFIVNFGSEALLFLAGICLIRMVFSVEFPDFQYIIGIPIHDRSINEYPFKELIFVCCAIMIIGTVISLYRMVHNYRTTQTYLRNSVHIPNPMAEDILTKLDSRCRLKVFQIAEVSVPTVIGYLKPIIYIPDIDFSEKELNIVILHEYTHWKNKDLWVKLIINVLVSAFWWNPFCYLLLKNLDETLELKCDRQVSKDFSEQEKTDYLETLLHTLKSSTNPKRTNKEVYSSELINIRNRTFSLNRFNYIISEPPSRAAQIRNKSIFIAIGCMLFFLSYHIIVQPRFDIPYNEAWEIGTDYVCTPENTYIKKVGDKYYLFSDGHSPSEVPAEFVEEGFSDDYIRDK